MRQLSSECNSSVSSQNVDGHDWTQSDAMRYVDNSVRVAGASARTASLCPFVSSVSEEWQRLDTRSRPHWAAQLRFCAE